MPGAAMTDATPQSPYDPEERFVVTPDNAMSVVRIWSALGDLQEAAKASIEEQDDDGEAEMGGEG